VLHRHTYAGASAGSSYFSVNEAEVDQSKRENDIKLKALMSVNSGFAESAMRGTAELSTHVIATDDTQASQAFAFLKDSAEIYRCVQSIARPQYSSGASLC
jgi:hypothetical protein